MVNKIIRIPLLVVISLLLSSCALFSPLGRALNKFSRIDNMTIELVTNCWYTNITTVMAIDGNRIEIQQDDVTQIMRIDYEEERVFIYLKEGNSEWYNTVESFYDIDFDETSDALLFNFQSEWFVKDENIGNLYWAKEEKLDEFESFTNLTYVDLSNINPSVSSVSIHLTEDEMIKKIKLLIVTDSGELYLTLSFSEFNETEVYLPL